MGIKVRESEIQRSILEYLTMRGHFVWRNNSGAYVGEHKGKTRFFRFGKKGSSDILGCAKSTGKIIAIEVKRLGGDVTPEQNSFLGSIQKENGIAFVAYSVDDVIKAGL